MEVLSPFDHTIIAEVPLQNTFGIEAALTLASTLAQKKPLPAFQRIAILEKTVALLEPKKESLAKQIALEGGKPIRDARVEVARAISGLRLAIQGLYELHGQEIPMGLNQASQNKKAFTFREPIGVVVAISAFNHPLNLAVHQIIPAVAVGCPVIIKPSLATPLSCLELVATLVEAGLPAGYCQTILCENELAEKLATDSRVDYLSFIGSSKVGWHLRSKLSPGTRCGLEHGGVAPVIVENPEYQPFIAPLLKSSFYHAGQVCVSTQRIFVQEAFAEKFAQDFSAATRSLVTGNPILETTDVGPLISEKEVNRIDSWIQASKARILCGGKKLPNFCYEPTVLWNPPLNSNVSTEEIFGPAVCIYPYKTMSEAIAKANAVRFAFQASIFTQHLDTAFSAISELNASTVLVNDHTAFRVDWMPFGGQNLSGLGKGGIFYSMQEYTKEKLAIFHSVSV